MYLYTYLSTAASRAAREARAQEVHTLTTINRIAITTINRIAITTINRIAITTINRSHIERQTTCTVRSKTPPFQAMSSTDRRLFFISVC